MHLNKRATTIPMEFLLAVLITLIIFIPSCALASKLTRVSEQAEQNFNSLVEKIKDMEQGKTKENIFFLLIMDKGTALLFFDPHTTGTTVKVDAEFPLTDYALYFPRPSSCPEEKGCLCLVQDPEYDVSVIEGMVTVIASSPSCHQFESQLKMENCNIGEAHNVNSYACSGGFMIERQLAQESSIFVDAYYEISRRFTLELTKTGPTIVLKAKS